MIPPKTPDKGGAMLGLIQKLIGLGVLFLIWDFLSAVYVALNAAQTAGGG